MGRVRILGVAIALLVGFSVSGCTTAEACPDIGWFNDVTVSLAGNADDIAFIEVCEDGVCTTSTAGPHDTQLGSAEPQQTGPQDSAPPSSVFSVTREDDSTWRVTYVLAAPETITIRALSSTGDVLLEQEVQLDWRRVGGSEECGGPSEAGPVTLDIP